jgi:hypothetical protein
MDSVEKMMESGIFWNTIKCPKCAREQIQTKNIFYNTCKMCRNIQVTALLGHMAVDAKYFTWIGKETSDITEEEIKRSALEEEQERLRIENLKEREAIIELLKEKEEQARLLLEAEEEDRIKEEEMLKNQREETNKMIREANILLEETAKYQAERAAQAKTNEISQDFKEMIEIERKEKKLGKSIMENSSILKESCDETSNDEKQQQATIETSDFSTSEIEEMKNQENKLKKEIIE